MDAQAPCSADGPDPGCLREKPKQTKVRRLARSARCARAHCPCRARTPPGSHPNFDHRGIAGDDAAEGPARPRSGVGAVCQMCHNAPSVPRAKTSNRPSELSITAGSLVMTPLSEAQPDQGPAAGAVCQLCQSTSSVPRANTSSRPSEFTNTAGSLVMLPPREDQADHSPAAGAVCQICHTALSVPGEDLQPPSVLSATTGSLAMMSPRGTTDRGPACSAICPNVPQRAVCAAAKTPTAHRNVDHRWITRMTPPSEPSRTKVRRLAPSASYAAARRRCPGRRPPTVRRSS